MTTTKKDYTAESMKHYEGVEAIRKRPSMFIGNTESEYGPIQLVLEAVTNSVDEFLNGHGSSIMVEFSKDGYCTVKDHGRGIPYDTMDVNGKQVPACIVVATMLNAGGKFDDDGSGAYKSSAGLNGVGLKCVCALSDHFILTTTRDGEQYSFETKRGKVSKKLYKTQYKPKANETGTTISFKLDGSIVKVPDFYNQVVKEQILQNCKLTAYLNKGLSIVLKYEGEKSISFKSENGIQDLINEETQKSKKLYEPIYVSAEHKGVTAEICFTHTNDDAENMFSFVNGLKVPLGGTHITGFRLSMTKIFTDYIRKHKLWGKTEVEITGEDIREGLCYAVSVKLLSPVFHSQVKDSLGSREAQSAVQFITNKLLDDIISEKPNLAKTIGLRIVAAAKGRMAAKRARETTRKNTLEGSNLSLPTKLKDCISTDPEQCELFICEGNSAGGSAEVGRDPYTQAILSLRGKILKVQGKELVSILKNAEINAIISSLGCGIGDSFDITKLRYHKIISMTDADVDGAHIRLLILTLLYNFFRPLIEHGYVYYANSPLYIIKQGSKNLGFLQTEEERKAWILERARCSGFKKAKTFEDLSNQDVMKVCAGIKFNYIKGLGELDANDLGQTTMNRKNRVLTRVTLKDAEEADSVFRVLMDSNAVEERKDFIQKNALDANLDI